MLQYIPVHKYKLYTLLYEKVSLSTLENYILVLSNKIFLDMETKTKVNILWNFIFLILEDTQVVVEHFLIWVWSISC